MNKTDGENSFQHIKLVLQNFFNRFEREYILVLKERTFMIRNDLVITIMI